MNKYQITIQFEMDENFMNFVPKHREFINKLINNNTIDYYTVSLENLHCWIVANAFNKNDIKQKLMESPLSKYWHTLDVHEIMVYDSLGYRLPELYLN